MEEAEIKKEERKLKRIFRDISKDKLQLCNDLIQNAAFMAVSLRVLQDEIRRNGPVITSINGNGFEVTQESAAQKSYNTMVNRYASVIKQLTDLLPDSKADNVRKAGEALAAFVVKGK